jgi:hypothetical protein
MGRKGSLEIKRCDTMPFGVFYQIGHQVMLLGLFLSVETWQEGPLIKFYPKSPEWNVLSQNWRDCWENPLDGEAARPATKRSDHPDSASGN